MSKLLTKKNTKQPFGKPSEMQLPWNYMHDVVKASGLTLPAPFSDMQ